MKLFVVNLMTRVELGVSAVVENLTARKDSCQRALDGELQLAGPEMVNTPVAALYVD
jgi:hypothetical protein